MTESQLRNNGGDSLLPKRKILILYGSETGNSQDVAEDIERLARRLHFETELEEMNDVRPDIRKTLTQHTFVVFVISTTGQGDLPKNAQQLWRCLRKKNLPPTWLDGVNFTTFGLGDSSYPQYNWAAKKLYVRLKQLGATEFFPRGEADERHDEGIDGAYLPWSLSLRKHLLTEYPLPDGLSPIPADVHLPPKITLELATMKGLDTKAAQFSHVDCPDGEMQESELMAQRAHPSFRAFQARLSNNTDIQATTQVLDRPNILKDHPSKYSLEEDMQISKAAPQDLLPIPDSWTATVISNERVTPEDHWQDVRALTLGVHPITLKDGNDDVLTYNPGDTLVLYPKNFSADVQALIDLMDWNDVADKPFVHWSKRKDGISIEHAPKNCYPVEKSTLRQLLLHNYDITAIPKRIFFDHIKFFATDQMQIQRITEFADPTYSDEFYDYTSRPRRSILEVLQEFSSVKIPYQWVPSIFPLIRGREYSIASGGSLGTIKDSLMIRVELLVALVKYKTVLRKTRQGLASRYIASLSAGNTMQVSIIDHRGPPLDSKELLSKPVYEQADPLGLPVLAIATGTGVAPIRSYFFERAHYNGRGDNVLFFGGRNQAADFFYKEDWGKLEVQVHTAFSRDQKEKVYVQDVIRREATKVCKLVSRRAIICVCGSTGKMPEAVQLALFDALVIGGKAKDRAESKAILDRLAYWQETW
ncbi:NADPH-dependent FMN/FAD containing oxidoreductase [Apiospora kogelbergensis]|uniref:NADPH-dependent diflavin oxidoreductase 1 n=1 Tax=Apiospora kogelbergensis TaxID=1337665 RepID=A0AAW0QTH9_9PEZI